MKNEEVKRFTSIVNGIMVTCEYHLPENEDIPLPPVITEEESKKIILPEITESFKDSSNFIQKNKK